MKVLVSEQIREMFPSLRIGIVTANINKEIIYDDLKDYCRDSYSLFRKIINSKETLLQHKNVEIWRNVYRGFGVNPKKKPPTAEAFLLRVIKDNYFPQICPVVDSYLVAERLHCLPIGGYDLSKVCGDVCLRVSAGNEQFRGIGSDSFDQTETGEIVYSDECSILTRRWNYRDAEHTSIKSDSRHIALFTEAPTPEISDSEITETIDEIAKNLRTYCGAETQTFFLDVKNNNSIELC